MAGRGGRVCWVFAWAAMVGACGGGSGGASGGNGGQGGSGSESSAGGVEVSAATLARGENEVTEAPPGGSPANAARRALDARQSEVLHCYETALTGSPDAHGSVDVELTFGRDGAVSNASAHAVDAQLSSIESCVADAVRAARTDSTELQGVRVRRSYTFVNPPADLTVATALVITAPPPPRRGRRGAAPAATTSANAAGGGPGDAAPASTATGLLTEADVSSALAPQTAALQACYGELLRTARTAAGTATLELGVSAAGAVETSSLSDPDGTFAPAQACVQNAVQSVRLRASITRTRVHVPLTFQR